MKKKLLGIMALSLAIISGQDVDAQNFNVTTELTPEKGYEVVTAMPENLSDYYYVITEKRATNYMVTASENDGPRYKYAVDPSTSLDVVWTVEPANGFNGYETGYSLKSLSMETYIHPGGSDSWNVWLTAYDKPNENTQFVFAYNETDGYWTFKNGPNKGEQYLGTWDDISGAFSSANVRMAANKTGNNIGQYLIYSIKRSDYAGAELKIQIQELEALKGDLNAGWQQRITDLVNEANQAQNSEEQNAAIENIKAMKIEIASYNERVDVFTSMIGFADELYSSSETLTSSEDRVTYKQAIDAAAAVAESASSLDAMNKAIEDCKQAIAELGPVEGKTLDFNYFTKDLSYRIDGWTKTYTTQNHQHNGSLNKNNGEYTVTTDEGYIENWNPSNFSTAGQLSYTLTDLPEGIYTLTAYTFDSSKSGKVDFFAGNRSVALDASTDLFSLSKLETVVVDSKGTLTFGLDVREANATNWIGISHIQMVKTGVANSDNLLAVLQQRIQEANDLVGQPMAEAEKGALEEAISVANNMNESSVTDDILNANSDLEAAIKAANISAATYASFKTKYDKAIAYVSERVAQLDASYDAETYNTTISAIEERYNIGTLGNVDEEVMTVYKALSAAAVSQEYKAGVDYSYAILNNSFEMGDMTGWAMPVGASQDTKVTTSTGDYVTAGIDGDYLFNTWWTGVAIEQTISGLPAGKYTLSALYASDKNNSGSYLVVNDVPSQLFQCEAGKGQFMEVSMDFELSENQDLNFFFQGAKEDGSYEKYVSWLWYKADNFRLTPVVESVNVSVSDAGWATMMLPFAAEIPAGMKVYTCGDVDENDILTLNEVTTIEANVPYIIASEKKDYTFEGANIAKENTYTSGILTGVYADTQAPVGSYVLQNQADGVAFYLVTDNIQPTVKANRAYLQLPASEANVRAIMLPGNDATGVESVEAADVLVDVYTVSGIRVRSNVQKSEALKGLKGVYILKAVK